MPETIYGEKAYQAKMSIYRLEHLHHRLLMHALTTKNTWLKQVMYKKCDEITDTAFPALEKKYFGLKKVRYKEDRTFWQKFLRWRPWGRKR